MGRHSPVRPEARAHLGTLPGHGPSRTGPPGRAACVEIVRTGEPGREGRAPRCGTWCAARRGLPGHAAFPVWPRPGTWAGGPAPSWEPAPPRPRPAALPPLGAEEAETRSAEGGGRRAGDAGARPWRLARPPVLPASQGLPFIPDQGSPGWRGAPEEQLRPRAPPSGASSGPGGSPVFPGRRVKVGSVQMEAPVVPVWVSLGAQDGPLEAQSLGTRPEGVGGCPGRDSGAG